MLPSFGVQFTNRLSGAFRLQADQAEPAERPVSLEITGHLPNILQALLSARVTLEGTISLRGFADDKPVAGELQIMPLRSMRLSLQFADNQGTACLIEAAKDFEVGEALKGKAELQAALRRQGGEALGTVRLEVDLMQSFGQFWGSLRPTGAG